MSNHGSQGPFGNDPAMHKALRQLIGEFPAGKLNAQDEGAFAFAVGVDQGKVVINFPKPVHWIGFPPDQAMELAEILIRHARAAGSKRPLMLKIG